VGLLSPDIRKADLLARLSDARARTYWLLSRVSERDAMKQHSPLMSPLLWDLGHIGNFEELWLVQELGEVPPIDPAYDEMYNAFVHPRRTRAELPLLERRECDVYLAAIRSQAIQQLQRADLDGSDPLTRDGYVFEMVIQHEYQHNETMLATLQLMAPPGYRPGLSAGRPARTRVDGMVFVEAGAFVLGTDDRCRAYDNERPAHEVHLPGFWIDAGPVTNQAYLEFIESGSYQRRDLWTDAGWAWLAEARVAAPQFWTRRDGGWVVNRFGHTVPLNPREPVQHVCFHEAQAFARWVGKRLPTEVEWEKAASWDPSAGGKRTYPWGQAPPNFEHANLDQQRFGPLEVGAYPDGVSACGCHQMIGDVWEWVDTDFYGYPGFEAWPYQEYSEVFFGDQYKILRGGSWATRPGAIRNTFRNWDYPIRRQIFSGFRCARDA
jgi:iron(II)-dependent oxidoreductase